MQVHSLPRANTPLLQSITLPPQINWQLKHPRFAIPSPSLPGWGQRAFCGTKPTIRAMLFIILHSWELFTWPSTPIVPNYASSYPTVVFHMSYAIKAIYYRDGHTPPQNMPLFATALKTSHRTTPWNICLHFGHVSRCPSGLWIIPLENGILHGTWPCNWVGTLRWELWLCQKSQSLFSLPFTVLTVLFQSGKSHTSCSTGKSCSTSLSSGTFP